MTRLKRRYLKIGERMAGLICVERLLCLLTSIFSLLAEDMTDKRELALIILRNIPRCLDSVLLLELILMGRKKVMCLAAHGKRRIMKMANGGLEILTIAQSDSMDSKLLPFRLCER